MTRPQSRAPLYRFPASVDPSAAVDDVRMVVELLRTGGPRLARRWVTALLRLDPARREALVAEAERLATGGDEITVVHPPRDRGGYVEQLERTYEVKPATDASARRRRARG